MDKKISAVILAGGDSRRMGEDKALLEIQGKTLLELLVDEVRPYVSEVIISTNRKEAYDFLRDVIFVEDYQKGEGPLGGIISSLEQASNDWSLVLSCDMPFFKGGVIPYLLERSDDCYCVVPWREGGFEPLMALYHKGACPLALTYLGCYDKKARGFVAYLDNISLVSRVDGKEMEKAFGPDLFANLNHPEDKERWRSMTRHE